MRVLLDTNIVIGYLKGDATIAPLFVAAAGGDADLAISVVSEFELLHYPSITDEEELRIAQLLTAFRVYSVERRTAQLAAALFRERRGAMADFLIAATAIEQDLPLFTRNVRDFKHIEGLNLLTDPSSIPLNHS